MSRTILTLISLGESVFFTATSFKISSLTFIFVVGYYVLVQIFLMPSILCPLSFWIQFCIIINFWKISYITQNIPLLFLFASDLPYVYLYVTLPHSLGACSTLNINFRLPEGKVGRSQEAWMGVYTLLILKMVSTRTHCVTYGILLNVIWQRLTLT